VCRLPAVSTASQKSHTELPTGCRIGRLSVAVNLSAVQLAQPNLVDEVAGALADAGLEARYLTLELTESLLIDNTDATVAKLKCFLAVVA
jgi:EAL domain-containing protein (putative c-di-GMP-specific phosphodiesterase class I)